MRRVSQLFYLAVFSLLGSSQCSSQLHTKEPTKSADPPPNVCAFEPGAIVSDACASYSQVEDLNESLRPFVHDITQNTDFFSYYRLNLYNKKCPFWSDENGICGNRACAVNTLDNEEDIPLVWRAEELGKLEGPKAHHPGKRLQEERKARPLQGELGEDVGESCVVEYDDECDERDYCVPEDESATAKGDYVSLVDNPERFTGYTGEGAHQVWEAIYRENCFSTPHLNAKPLSAPPSSPFGGFTGAQAQAAMDLRHVMKEQQEKQGVKKAIAQGSAPAHPISDLEFEDECLEKRVFYRVISGMHASISTHLCWEWLNQTTGEWQPNLSCYENRLHNHPERISNLYFNYALVLRAVGKLKQHVQSYSFCSSDPIQDRETKRRVLALAAAIPPGEQIFDESVMFRDPDALTLKEDFRNRFRNVSRIMDCVGCDKCRLWGKLQTAGYGTALKVLFEFNETDASSDPPLRRTELVALVNTLDRISHSISVIQKFRAMVEQREAGKVAAAHGAAGGKVRGTAEVRGKKAERGVAEDDGYPEAPKQRRQIHEQTLSEAFWDEWYRVWRTFAYVIRSWFNIPGKVLEILLEETNRLYSFWLGLPVGPRKWEIRLPSRDEI
ncbi:hypothetical protein W97_03501 [Coniosporium apollinis CBS 100218]|uniref:Endoplasmic oxidoreductin-1 n=1 Tax=Coniosporium apollinis (strain CBS 100218) TaxID=1168221 RepID=R7YQS1_CONA1|nr:uncharacterized protein W97_03501 [Coniosporium apollinis CBS 100218]EON64270.1 hypothetical protein W97_03501 [Coniosporium apollinis CBS 100218]